MAALKLETLGLASGCWVVSWDSAKTHCKQMLRNLKKAARLMKKAREAKLDKADTRYSLQMNGAEQNNLGAECVRQSSKLKSSKAWPYPFGK